MKMSKVPSLLLALLFCLMPFIMVSADPNVPGDDLVETSFSGIVTDSETSEPIQGARVYGHDQDFQVMRSSITDEEGKYYLEFKDGGDYTIYADHPDYEVSTQEVSVEISSETELDFSLVPKTFESRIYGVVTDSGSGDPLSDAFVRLWEIITYEDGESYSFVTSIVTSDDGKFSFDVEEGTFQVEVMKEGYDRHVSYYISVRSGEELEYNVELDQWARGVFGTVFDENGDPFPDVTVSLETDGRNSIEFTTTTDENGEYEIRVPRGGDYTLKAFMDGYRPYSQDMNLPQDSMAEQDIEMTKALLPDPLLRILYLILSILGLM
jgi:protocatechuate 3,4-dioxygenase beta subunit